MSKAYILNFEVLKSNRGKELVGVYTDKSKLWRDIDDKINSLLSYFPSYTDYKMMEENDGVVLIVKCGRIHEWRHYFFTIEEYPLNESVKID